MWFPRNSVLHLLRIPGFVVLLRSAYFLSSQKLGSFFCAGRKNLVLFFTEKPVFLNWENYFLCKTFILYVIICTLEWGENTSKKRIILILVGENEHQLCYPLAATLQERTPLFFQCMIATARWRCWSRKHKNMRMPPRDSSARKLRNGVQDLAALRVLRLLKLRCGRKHNILSLNVAD